MSGSWADEAAVLLVSVAADIDEGADLDDIEPLSIHNLYLLSSLLYYERGVSIFSDSSFDRVCKYLLTHRKILEEVVWWPEKTLDEDSLRAGTGYSIEYPGQIFDIAACAVRYIKQEN